MPIQRICKLCGIKIKVYNTLQNKCKDCTYKTAKPIPKRGKEYSKYETWKKVMAIPYLTQKYGLRCHICKKTDVPLDVAHVKTRGARHDLKYDVMNVRWLCRPCHRLETDGKLKIHE